MVTVKLNLTLSGSLGKDEFMLKLDCPRTLASVMEEIGIPPEDAGMVIKNKKWAPLDCIVEENDEVLIFPHLEGG